jgi:hypothetical protein
MAMTPNKISDEEIVWQVRKANLKTQFSHEEYGIWPGPWFAFQRTQDVKHLYELGFLANRAAMSIMRVMQYGPPQKVTSGMPHNAISITVNRNGMVAQCGWMDDAHHKFLWSVICRLVGTFHFETKRDLIEDCGRLTDHYMGGWTDSAVQCEKDNTEFFRQTLGDDCFEQMCKDLENGLLEERQSAYDAAIAASERKNERKESVR